MNRLAVTLSVMAERDVTDIATYIALDSPAAARQFETELWHALERIGQFPDAGGRVESQGVAMRITRVSRRFRRYLIFARSADEASVEIVRILHGARDLTALFADDGQPSGSD